MLKPISVDNPESISDVYECDCCGSTIIKQKPFDQWPKKEKDSFTLALFALDCQRHYRILVEGHKDGLKWRDNFGFDYFFKDKEGLFKVFARALPRWEKYHWPREKELPDCFRVYLEEKDNMAG